MNYFRARSAEKLFLQYRDLATSYWDAKPSWQYMGGAQAKKDIDEIENHIIIRKELNRMLPKIKMYANEIGVNVMVKSIPPPAVGGVILPVNILESAIDRCKGHSTMSKDMILDKIDQCIGAAKTLKRESLLRLVCPINWVIDIPALIIRFPFLILRKAGLPAKVEENILSNIIKILLTIILVVLLVYFGLEKYIPDFLKIFK